MFKPQGPIMTKRIMLTGALMIGASIFATTSGAFAETYGSKMPSLIITTDDLPTHLTEKVYAKPIEVRSITATEVSRGTYRQPTETMVTRKVADLSTELYRVQQEVEELSDRLGSTQKAGEDWAAAYYASVATINTQLQSGTTKSNPRLVGQLSDAEIKLENLNDNLGMLNSLAAEAADISSEASFLLEETRAAYGIAGAVEEDHVELAKLEDTVNNTLVIIDRVLNTVNDDITRTSTYLSSERSNLRTLALAVSNGDLYGKSLSNRPFSSAAAPYGQTGYHQASATSPAAYVPPAPNAPTLSGPRPLAKIRFDRSDVEYQQPLYAAVNEALQRYPNARFDLVAVHPANGNAAQVAIESTKARRNAEKVLRTLTQMGLPIEQIDLSYSDSAQAASNEVHLFVK